MKAKAKRPTAVLRLKVDGKHIKPGRIPVPELMEILARAQEAVNRQAEALRGRPGVRPGPKPTVVKEACTLELFAIGRGSAVISFSNPDPEPKAQGLLDIEIEDLGKAAVRTIVDALKSKGSRRRRDAVEMDDGVRQSLVEMGKMFRNGVDRVDWIAPSQAGNKRPVKARFDASVLARLEAPAKGKTYREIAMDGLLEMADFEVDDLKCRIHAPDGQRVVCTFAKDLEDDVYAALRGIARVTGLGTYIQPSDRLDRIELYSVKKLDPFLSAGDNFFEGLNLAELTKAQRVDPAFDLRTLPSTWPKDEDVEAFLDAIGER